MKRLAITIILIVFFCQWGGTQINTNGKKNFDHLYQEAKKLIGTNIEQAIVNTHKASVLAKGHRDLYRVNFLLGYLYHQNKEYTRSNEYYKKSLPFARKESEKISVQNNISGNFLKLGNFKKALLLAQKVLKYRKKTHSKYIYNTYTNIGQLYSKLGSIDSAKYFLGNAYNEIKVLKDDKIIANHFFTLAKMYEDFGYSDSAIFYYQQSRKLRIKDKDKCNVSLHIAQCYIKKGDLEAGNRHLVEAEMRQIEGLYNQTLLLRMKGELFFKQKNFKKFSLINKQLNKLLDDHLNDVVKGDQAFYIETRKELFQKRNLLQNEAHQKNVLKLEKTKHINLVIIFLTLFSLFVTLILFRRYKAKIGKMLQPNSLNSKRQYLLQNEQGLIERIDAKLPKPLDMKRRYMVLIYYHEHNFSGTARVLGIARNTLLARMDKLSLEAGFPSVRDFIDQYREQVLQDFKKI